MAKVVGWLMLGFGFVRSHFEKRAVHQKVTDLSLFIV